MGYINWFFMIFNIILLVSIHNIWDDPSHWLIFFKMVKTTIQLRISNLRDFAQIHYSWHSVLSLPMSQYFNIFQTWHSLHKVTSFCAVPLQKVVQHFFERNRLIFKKTYSRAKFLWRCKGIYGRGTALFQNGILWVLILNDCVIPSKFGASVGKAALTRGWTIWLNSMQ
jgi:hypothetical protein